MSFKIKQGLTFLKTTHLTPVVVDFYYYNMDGTENKNRFIYHVKFCPLIILLTSQQFLRRHVTLRFSVGRSVA